MKIQTPENCNQQPEPAGVRQAQVVVTISRPPPQLYLGEKSEPQVIPTSNLGQPGLTQGPTQIPFDDNLGPKKV